MRSLLRTCFLVAGVASLVYASPASALTLGFNGISANDVGDVAIGESQLSVEVTDAGGNQVLFTFQNAGPEASSITDVYFDDRGEFLSLSAIDDSQTGVEFSAGASPGNLPAANNASPPFVATDGLSADSDPPVQPNGVNPGESLGILFDIDGNYGDVLAALDGGRLRVGIHVQGFGSGGSESFVNNGERPPGERPIPEPGAALLFLAGGLIVGGAVRRGAIR